MYYVGTRTLWVMESLREVQAQGVPKTGTTQVQAALGILGSTGESQVGESQVAKLLGPPPLRIP